MNAGVHLATVCAVTAVCVTGCGKGSSGTDEANPAAPKVSKSETAPATTSDGITNGCTVASLGTKGFRLAGQGGAHVNMMDALKSRLAGSTMLNSNVTVRVGFAKEEAEAQTVTFGFGASEGRYVATTDSIVLCEVIDNMTATVTKTVRITARGDITASAFYEGIADDFVRAMSQ